MAWRVAREAACHAIVRANSNAGTMMTVRSICQWSMHRLFPEL
jgi:hypothetical protein